MKRTRLRSASLVGWHGQFPVELWSIIIRFLPLTPYRTLDLAMILRLLSVCKGMLDALMAPILGYLRETISYRERRQTTMIEGGNKRLSFACMTWSVLEDLQKKSGRDHFARYIEFCLFDRRYQTLEHLSNCLSLLHYGYLEGTHCRELAYCNGATSWVTMKVTSPTEAFDLRDVFYFNPKNKKAVLLARMKEVSCYDYVGVDTLRERARQCLVKNGMEDKMIQTVIVDSLSRSSDREKEAVYLDIIENNEENLAIDERTLKTRKARVIDVFPSIIVTRNNKRCHILANASKDFRTNCFFLSNATCQSAAYFFLLSKSREANEKSINETQRYCIPPHITLTK